MKFSHDCNLQKSVFNDDDDDDGEKKELKLTITPTIYYSPKHMTGLLRRRDMND